MKRYFFIASILVFSVFLAGCSLGNSGTPVSAPKVGSIWRSADGGKTWEVKNQSVGKIAFSDVDVLSIAVSPADPNVVLFGTKANGIIKTEDGGNNLQATNFTSAKVYGLEISPADNQVIYASGIWQGRGKIFKSSDFGENWEEIYTMPANGPLVISLTIDKNNSQVIYASSSDNQIIKTTDGGKTWKNIFASLSPAFKIAIDKGNSNLIYFTTVSGAVFRSKNGGETFEDISKPVLEKSGGNRDAAVIATDPYNSGWIYVAGGVGILRSKNAGDGWEKINTLNNPQNFPVKALAINPTNSKEMIYGAAQTIYRSEDDGVNWATFQFQSARMAKVLKYSASDANIVYLGLNK